MGRALFWQTIEYNDDGGGDNNNKAGKGKCV